MLNSSEGYEEIENPMNPEKILFDIAASVPITSQIHSFRTFYEHKDPHAEFDLAVGERIKMRIWKHHMNDSNRNRELSKTKIFISAKKIIWKEEQHQKLYWWYDPLDTITIWKDALNKK